MDRYSSQRFLQNLRWVMLAVILFDMVLTLVGQPTSYWKNPSTAHEENQTYHMIMSKGIGWLITFDLFYLIGSFLLVSVLPTRLASTLLFALILGHFFGGASWLCFRFGMGATGLIAYALLLAAIISEILSRSKRWEKRHHDSKPAH